MLQIIIFILLGTIQITHLIFYFSNGNKHLDNKSVAYFSSVPCESIRLKFILSQSELFRFIPISVSEPMRMNPNQSEKRFVSCLMKNGQKSIRLNPINSETSIRMNPNQSEIEFSIQINPSQSELGLIWIENLVSNLIQFHNYFCSFYIFRCRLNIEKKVIGIKDFNGNNTLKRNLIKLWKETVNKGEITYKIIYRFSKQILRNFGNGR